jgi:hypothetical protein
VTKDRGERLQVLPLANRLVHAVSLSLLLSLVFRGLRGARAAARAAEELIGIFRSDLT